MLGSFDFMGLATPTPRWVRCGAVRSSAQPRSAGNDSPRPTRMGVLLSSARWWGVRGACVFHTAGHVMARGGVCVCACVHVRACMCTRVRARVCARVCACVRARTSRRGGRSRWPRGPKVARASAPPVATGCWSPTLSRSAWCPCPTRPSGCATAASWPLTPMTPCRLRAPAGCGETWRRQGRKRSPRPSPCP